MSQASIQRTTDGRLVLDDGRIVLGHALDPCCCDGEYYFAVRCDVRYPPPFPLPIPDTIPAAILIPAPFHCPGEACEINGLRVVVYGGYCYVVEETDEPMAEPCDDRLRARRYARSDLPEEAPPIADPGDVRCQPLGATCGDDCLPEVECCLASAPCEGCPPAEPGCYCPPYGRALCVVEWSGFAKYKWVASRCPEGNCEPAFETAYQGLSAWVFDCQTPNAPQRVAFSVWGECQEYGPCEFWGEGPVCPLWRARYLEDPAVNPAFARPPASFGAPPDYTTLAEGCVGKPWSIALRGECFPHRGENIEVFTQPLFGDTVLCAFEQVLEPDAIAPLAGRSKYLLSAGCFGGSWTSEGFRHVGPHHCAFAPSNPWPGCQFLDRYAISIRWHWLPLARCPQTGFVSQRPLPYTGARALPAGASSEALTVATSGCAGCGAGEREEVS